MSETINYPCDYNFGDYAIPNCTEENIKQINSIGSKTSLNSLYPLIKQIPKIGEIYDFLMMY